MYTVATDLKTNPNIVLIGSIHASLSRSPCFSSELVGSLSQASHLLIDRLDPGQPLLLIQNPGLSVQLSRSGQIQSLIPEPPSELQQSLGMVQQIRRGEKVLQLDGAGFERGSGRGEIVASSLEGGEEGVDGGTEGGEGGGGLAEGEERGEEVGMAGEDLGAEVTVQEADRLLEGLGARGRGAGGEGLGGESGGVEGGGEEGGEDGVGGESLERGGLRRVAIGDGLGEGGEAVERGDLSLRRRSHV